MSSTVNVKFKMTGEQFNHLYCEYLATFQDPKTPYFKSFNDFLDWKYSDLIDQEIDKKILKEFKTNA